MNKAIKKFVITFASLFADRAIAALGYKQVTESYSGDTLATLRAMRDSMDTSAYLSAVRDIFGSGGNNKAEDYIAGALPDALSASIRERVSEAHATLAENAGTTVDEEAVKADTEAAYSAMRFQMSQTRTVARWIADRTRDNGTDAMRTLYTAAKDNGATKGTGKRGAVTPTASTENGTTADAKKPSEVKARTCAEAVRELLSTFNPGDVLAAMADALEGTKAKTQASALRAISTQPAVTKAKIAA